MIRELHIEDTGVGEATYTFTIWKNSRVLHCVAIDQTIILFSPIACEKFEGRYQEMD